MSAENLLQYRTGLTGVVFMQKQNVVFIHGSSVSCLVKGEKLQKLESFVSF